MCARSAPLVLLSTRIVTWCVKATTHHSERKRRRESERVRAAAVSRTSRTTAHPITPSRISQSVAALQQQQYRHAVCVCLCVGTPVHTVPPTCERDPHSRFIYPSIYLRTYSSRSIICFCVGATSASDALRVRERDVYVWPAHLLWRSSHALVLLHLAKEAIAPLTLRSQAQVAPQCSCGVASSLTCCLLLSLATHLPLSESLGVPQRPRPIPCQPKKTTSLPLDSSPPEGSAEPAFLCPHWPGLSISLSLSRSCADCVD